MNEPTNKELLDSLGVEVEIKKENQFTSINEHVFSGFEEIQDFLSSKVTTNVRELVGAINRIVSFSRIYKKIFKKFILIFYVFLKSFYS